MRDELIKLTEDAVKIAQRLGAQEVSAGAGESREVEVQWRDGALEKISEATSRSLGLQLYVDGRYSSVGTSDLRPDAVERFIAEAVALTRLLAPDPFRALPDAKLYEGRPTVELELEDPAYDTVTPQRRLDAVQELERASRDLPGADKIVSVTTSWSDNLSESYRVHSNGFHGERRQTSFWISANTTVQDSDGRKPDESAHAGARLVKDLARPGAIGREATQRALSRLGAKKVESRVAAMAVDHRVAGRLIGYFLGPLSAASVQQQRSMFEGKQGQAIAGPLLGVTDDPLIKKGFGSRLWDGEGIASRRLPILEQGVLQNFYVDTYYGKKLKWAPTTGGMSNLSFALGAQDQASLLRDLGEGILVTGFLGGNSNGTTGDFSLGVQGFVVRGGQLAEPVAEMNISGSHLNLWRRLAAVGNDPYPYSSLRAPSLVFDGVQFAGG